MLISTQRSAAAQHSGQIADKTQTVQAQSLADNVKSWSDALLYSKCKTYGFNARVWLRKFAGLLPEVNRRQLYKRRGYASLHEFARKLAGMSDYTTDKILCIAAKLEDKPALKEQFVSGEEGWSKIETVVYIATPETDKFWAKKVSSLTKRALVAYVHEIKKHAFMPHETNGSFMLKFTAGGDANNQINIRQDSLEMPSGLGYSTMAFGNLLPGDTSLGQFSAAQFARMSFPISPQLERELKLFKQKLEKQRSQTLAWSEVMQELLRGYATKRPGDGTGVGVGVGARVGVGNPIARTKTTTVAICPDCVKKKTNEAAEIGAVNRHIPADVKKIVDERYHNWCAYPDCRRPPDIYHHTRRFGLVQNHDPDFIVPLCSSHERLAHAGLVGHEDKNPALWRILAEPDRRAAKFCIDQKMNEYRGERGHPAA